jgi:hypothetical protein
MGKRLRQRRPNLVGSREKNVVLFSPELVGIPMKKSTLKVFPYRGPLPVA